MLYGIGVDMVRIARVQKSLESPAFWRRVYGAQEQALLAALPAPRRAASAAANFAAKEAFLKAAGAGLGGFALAEVQALRRESGAPYLCLCGGALAWARQNRLTAQLSLTHEGGFAAAFVVLEQAE